MTAQSLFEKVWQRHVVVPETADTPAVLYIDLHLTHEVTSPQAFDVLRARGLPVRRLDRTLATMDHSTPTDTAQIFGGLPIKLESAARQVRQLEVNCAEFGVNLLGLQDSRRGIVHVIGPELGATQPGKTIVCGDSHTSTHGAFGALAFGIGTTEVGHVLATQCLLQRKPKTLAIDVDGTLPAGVTAKDVVLAVIGRIGVNGGTGHVIEYRGTAIAALSMDERMTVCNMSIEAGARAGMIAPDDTTYRVPAGPSVRAAGRGLGRGRRRLAHAAAATRARLSTSEVTFDASDARADDHVRHQPGHGHPDQRHRAGTAGRCRVCASRWPTWGSTAGEPHGRQAGATSSSSAAAPTRASRTCEAAAAILRGRKVASGVRALVVPGSQQIKREAEAARAWHKIFTDAGAEWRESGCSMCIGMNGDTRRRRPVLRQHQQPQLRGPARHRRTHRCWPARRPPPPPPSRGRVTDPREFLG